VIYQVATHCAGRDRSSFNVWGLKRKRKAGSWPTCRFILSVRPFSCRDVYMGSMVLLRRSLWILDILEGNMTTHKTMILCSIPLTSQLSFYPCPQQPSTATASIQILEIFKILKMKKTTVS
jgi:hypothetical protein